ncbi:MAG TPA: MFS transporter [Blastocatellia bacterium]|nr:MFS transporter [Blastocatellia bacterium]
MRPQFTGLWRHPDFLKLWIGQTISLFGSQITALALPLTAVLTLQATPSQMGTLRATHSASAMLAGLFAGVLADRVRRRPILIGTDLGFSILAGSIPVAAFLGLLRIEQLYLVQFFSGVLAVFSDVTHMAFLPSLAQRHQLVEANSKLQTTSSAASIAGPGLAGVLTQMFTAPMALILDALSFLISALFIWRIRAPETPAAPVANRKSVWAEIGEGLRFVFGNSALRPLAEAIAIHFLFNGLLYSVFILYASRELKIESSLLGVIFAASGLGLLTGALAAARMARGYGQGPTMLGASFTSAVAALLIPLANGPFPAIVVMLVFAQFLQAVSIQINGINLVSLRQGITPAHLQGRMNATFRFLNLTAATIGALLAGAFSEVLGLRMILAVGAGGLFIPFLRLLFSPMRNLREVVNTE